jgi:large subunit ribosomal protein L4
MPDVQSFSPTGAPAETVTLDPALFGRAPNPALLHQAVVAQLANARQGTHDTLTRGEVNRTTKKVWRQKGTGRARQGSRKGPHWRGGGVAFGPHPRSYRQNMPRKMRQGALRAALSAKAAAGEIVILQEISMEAPSTKGLRQLLEQVSQGRSQLIVLDGPQRNVQLSARNLPHVKAITTNSVNVVDVLRYEHLVLSLAAVRTLEARYGAAVSPAPQPEAPAAPEASQPEAPQAPQESRPEAPEAEE